MTKYNGILKTKGQMDIINKVLQPNIIALKEVEKMQLGRWYFYVLVTDHPLDIEKLKRLKDGSVHLRKNPKRKKDVSRDAHMANDPRD